MNAYCQWHIAIVNAEIEALKATLIYSQTTILSGTHTKEQLGLMLDEMAKTVLSIAKLSAGIRQLYNNHM